MDHERGWTASEHDIRTVWFLDWLDERRREEPSSVQTVSSFIEAMEPLHVSEPDLLDVLTSVEARGLVTVERVLSGDLDSAVWLTGLGVEDVRARQQRRQDTPARRVACRDAFMAWLYDQRTKGNQVPRTSEFFLDPRGYYEGRLFETDDVDEATRYLRDRGLVQGTPTWGAGVLRPSLSADGIDCVEQFGSDVHAYLSRGAAAGPTTNYHFVGAGNVNVAHASSHVQQSISPTEIDVQALLDFTRPVRQAIGALGLGDEDQARLSGYLDEIDTEVAKADPDHRRLKQLGGYVLGVLKTGSATALGTALVNLAPAAIQAISNLPG